MLIITECTWPTFLIKELEGTSLFRYKANQKSSTAIGIGSKRQMRFMIDATKRISSLVSWRSQPKQNLSSFLKIRTAPPISTRSCPKKCEMLRNHGNKLKGKIASLSQEKYSNSECQNSSFEKLQIFLHTRFLLHLSKLNQTYATRDARVRFWLISKPFLQ